MSESRNASIILLGEKQGDKLGKSNISVSSTIMENSNAELEFDVELIESNGLPILDPKRHRTDDPISTQPIVKKIKVDDPMLDMQFQNKDNQKK